MTTWSRQSGRTSRELFPRLVVDSHYGKGPLVVRCSGVDTSLSSGRLTGSLIVWAPRVMPCGKRGEPGLSMAVYAEANKPLEPRFSRILHKHGGQGCPRWIWLGRWARGHWALELCGEVWVRCGG